MLQRLCEGIGRDLARVGFQPQDAPHRSDPQSLIRHVQKIDLELRLRLIIGDFCSRYREGFSGIQSLTRNWFNIGSIRRELV